jgi:hypothetical protein
VHRLLAIALLVALGACRGASPLPSPSYLFVWAGDADENASDFLGVIDATPGSEDSEARAELQ